MNTLRAALLSTTALASLATIAACSGGGGAGGGGGAAPCCFASGETEQPPQAFGAVPLERFVQPIAFLSTDGCVTTTGGMLSLPEYESIGDEVAVQADGSYLVEIDEEGAGRRVVVRVFDRDEDGNETERGIGALAELPIVDAEAPAIPVAPIRFGANPAKMGESTLELAVHCTMRNTSQLQNLSFNDVRALVTSSFAGAYTGTDDVDNAIAFAGRYRHAINGVVNLSQQNKATLERLREEADRLVDACRSPEPPANLSCSSDGRAEFYRYWHMARRVDDADYSLPTPLVRSIREHLQAFAQDMSDAISDPFGGNPITDARAFELFRENHRIRLEIASAAVEAAATCFGAGAMDSDGDGVCTTAEGDPMVDFDAAIDTGRGPISMRESFEAIREGILSAPDEAALESVWAVNGEDILQNFGLQSGLMTTPDVSEDLDVLWDDALSLHQTAAQFAILTDFTHLEIAGELFDPGPTVEGAWEKIHSDLNTDFAALSDPDHARVTDILFYSTANATDITTP